MNIGKSFRILKRNMLYRYEGPRVIRANYRRFFGRSLAKTSTTLTAKIAHRMIHLHKGDHRALAHRSDKFLVRGFVKERIGEQYLVNLIWHGSDPTKIPFNDLPDQCMAKTNHASGTNLLLKRPVDRQDTVDKFAKWLKMNYYFVGREIQYKSITPRILIERFLDDGSMNGPLDYRFWCFNGKPEVIQVDNNDHSINTFFDLDWKTLNFGYRNFGSVTNASRPSNLKEMIEVASALSSGFDFVRVDMYNLGGEIIFGEMTFTPVSGLFKLVPSDWDNILGEKWPSTER